MHAACRRCGGVCQAVEQAWLVDPDRTGGHPWIDLILMRIHRAGGQTSELRTMLERLIEARGIFQTIDELAGNLLLRARIYQDRLGVRCRRVSSRQAASSRK
jgi:hypothetical protein